VSYLRDIHGIASLRFLPFSANCYPESISCQDRGCGCVLSGRPPSRKISVRNDDQNFMAATGPVGQRHVELGSLPSSLASIRQQQGVLEAVAPTMTPQEMKADLGALGWPQSRSAVPEVRTPSTPSILSS